MTDPNHISRAALASVLGVTTRTLHHWRKQGRFPEPFRGGPTGKAKYYDLEEVREAIATHKLKVKIR